MDEEVLVLTAPVPPLELRYPACDDPQTKAAIDTAMKAALRGDFGPLDRLELECLNLLVRIGELRIKRPAGTLHWWFDERDARFQRADREFNAPFVIGLVRGLGRDARTALEWQLREQCRRCQGRLRHIPCRVCEGRWYVEDMSDHQVLYTDVAGVLLPECDR